MSRMTSAYTIVPVAKLNAKRRMLGTFPTPKEHEAAGARVEFEIHRDGERLGYTCETATAARKMVAALTERDADQDSLTEADAAD